MSAPWYLEKGQREIVAGRRFEGGAPFNVAGIRGKAERRAGGVRAAGDEQRGRAVRAADDADGTGGGRAFNGLRPDGAVALARVGNQNRLGGLRVEREAQKREVRGEAAAERGYGSVCASSDSAVSVCSVPVYGCVKRNASPGARTVKRGPGSGAGVRRRESSIE